MGIGFKMVRLLVVVAVLSVLYSVPPREEYGPPVPNDFPACC